MAHLYIDDYPISLIMCLLNDEICGIKFYFLVSLGKQVGLIVLTIYCNKLSVTVIIDLMNHGRFTSDFKTSMCLLYATCGENKTSHGSMNWDRLSYVSIPALVMLPFRLTDWHKVATLRSAGSVEIPNADI